MTQLQILRRAADRALSGWAQTAITSSLTRGRQTEGDTEGEGRGSSEKWGHWSQTLPCGCWRWRAGREGGMRLQPLQTAGKSGPAAGERACPRPPPPPPPRPPAFARGPCFRSCLHSDKTMHACCFKPPGWWPFVSAARDNESTHSRGIDTDGRLSAGERQVRKHGQSGTECYEIRGVPRGAGEMRP